MVDKAMSYWRSQASSWVKVEENWGPLSEITFECKLSQGKTWQKKSRATSAM